MGGALVGGAFWVRSATTVWAAWVWIMATSCVGAGVTAPAQALNTSDNYYLLCSKLFRTSSVQISLLLFHSSGF